MIARIAAGEGPKGFSLSDSRAFTGAVAARRSGVSWAWASKFRRRDDNATPARVAPLRISHWRLESGSGMFIGEKVLAPDSLIRATFRLKLTTTVRRLPPNSRG